MKTRRDIFERRFEKTDGCWLWKGCLNNYGYAIYSYGPNRNAARVSYRLYVGEIPKDHHVHHTCEKRNCVNPDHLKPIHKSKHKALHRKPDVCAGCGGVPDSAIRRQCKACRKKYMAKWWKEQGRRKRGQNETVT